MDTGTLFIGLICFALCLAPFVLLGRKRKQKEKEICRNFYAFAGEHQSAITKEEILKSCMIGIDENKKTLFFIRNSGGQWEKQQLKLQDIRRCELVKVNASGAFTSIELVLMTKNQDKVGLVFFREEEDGELGLELMSATKWQDILSGML